MADGSTTPEIPIVPQTVEQSGIRGFLNRFRREAKPTPHQPPKDTSQDINKVRAELDSAANQAQIAPKGEVKLDERGEAIGPYKVEGPGTSGDFLLIDSRTGKPQGSYADQSEAQKFADRGNAMEAIRGQQKSPVQNS